MKRIDFDTVEELAIVVEAEYNDMIYNSNDELDSVGIICDYGLATMLVSEFAKLDIPLFSIEMINPEINAYDGLFAFDLNLEGIWVEPLNPIKYIQNPILFIDDQYVEEVFDDKEVSSKCVYSFILY